MAKVETKQGVYGEVKVIDNWNGIKRLYVKRTNVKTYIVSTDQRLTLDTMLEINGEYHFRTIAELNLALNV